MTDQVYRHGHFDLLALSKSAKISVYQSAPNRVDLTVLKDNVMNALTCDVEREHSIDTRVRSKDRSQLTQRRRRGHAFHAASVNYHGHLSIHPQPTSFVLATRITFFRFYYKFFCHNFTLTK
jgi:hypothetical protein